MTRRYGIGLLAATLVLWGCRNAKPPPPRPASPDAQVTPVRPGPAVAVAAPPPVPVTAAQRAFDGRHHAALARILRDLKRIYTESVAFQARGLRKPASRAGWPAKREQLLSEAGGVRARILAVDPLGNRSWAMARATVLLRYLTVTLPDAIRESWRMRPSGAFTTWRSDFRLIWRRLQRYVRSLLKQLSGPPSKDTK